MRNPWILDPGAGRAGEGVRLFCLPHAGGSTAVFRGWPRRLAPRVLALPVQVPGRSTRLRERPCTRLRELAAALAAGLEPDLGREHAFFGHSLGALLAFETIRELRRRGAPPPVHLFVSARRGPRLPQPGTPLHALPDADLVEQVSLRWGGIPEEVRREPEVLSLLLPSLRADLEMLETYEYMEEAPLHCPITALTGQEDVENPPEASAPWADETRGAFTAHAFPGGHFYTQTAEAEIADLLLRTLGSTASAGRGPEDAGPGLD